MVQSSCAVEALKFHPDRTFNGHFMEEEKLDKNSNSSHRKIGSGGEIELRSNLCREMIHYLFYQQSALLATAFVIPQTTTTIELPNRENNNKETFEKTSYPGFSVKDLFCKVATIRRG